MENPPPKHFAIWFAGVALFALGGFSVVIKSSRLYSEVIESSNFIYCIDNSGGIDGIIQDCADFEISRLNSIINRIKSAPNLFKNKGNSPYSLDGSKWDDYTDSRCKDQIRIETGVNFYEEYGTMERLLHRMCILDETKKRLLWMRAKLDADANAGGI